MPDATGSLLRSTVGWGFRDGLHEVTDLVVREVPGDIRLADDADQVVSVDDREPTYTVLAHRGERFLDRVIGPDRDGRAVRQVGYLRCAWVAVSRESADHDVTVGYHASQLAVVTTDRQGADVEVAHLASCFHECVVDAGAFCARGHDVANVGHGASSFGRVRCRPLA